MFLKDADFPFSSQQEFDNAIKEIAPQVELFLRKFNTRIVKVHGDYSVTHGSGSYVIIMNTVCILTAAHVSAEPIVKGFVINGKVHGINPNHFSIPYPLDISIVPITTCGNWDFSSPDVRAISHAKLHPLTSHPREIFAFMGSSRERNKQLFGVSLQQTTTSLAPIVDLPANDRFTSAHIGIAYTPEKARNSHNGVNLPKPDGFSGATLWNTRLVESAINKQEWKPELMQVAGVIWYWRDDLACLVATRVELVQAVFLAMAAALEVFGPKMDAIFHVMQHPPSHEKFLELSALFDVLAGRRNKLAEHHLERILNEYGLPWPRKC